MITQSLEHNGKACCTVMLTHVELFITLKVYNKVFIEKKLLSFFLFIMNSAHNSEIKSTSTWELGVLLQLLSGASSA